MAVAQEQIQQNAVSLKFSTFWTSQPKVWFQRTKAPFALQQVAADDTKYFYVVTVLDQDSAQRVVDLLEHLPRNRSMLLSNTGCWTFLICQIMSEPLGYKIYRH